MRPYHLKRAALSRVPFGGSSARTGRLYASSATPGQSSNVANPQSSNPESQSINVKRGTKGGRSDNPDGRSVASPISGQRGPSSEAHEGEEQTSTDAQIKNDPNLPVEEKRAHVKQAGQKPLGPEDAER